MPYSRRSYPPIIEMLGKPRAVQGINGFRVSGPDLLKLLSMFDPYGVWRIDIKSGLVYWTDDIFEIHEMEPKTGPVNLTEALSYYHPKDRDALADAISDVIEKKSGFRAVLRFARRNGEYKYVKWIGQYRVNSKGREEIYGIYTLILRPEPVVSLIE